MHVVGNINHTCGGDVFISNRICNRHLGLVADVLYFIKQEKETTLSLRVHIRSFMRQHYHAQTSD